MDRQLASIEGRFPEAIKKIKWLIVNEIPSFFGHSLGFGLQIFDLMLKLRPLLGGDSDETSAPSSSIALSDGASPPHNNYVV